MIEVKHISKQFNYYSKSQGLKATLKNLFYREKLIKNAVNDISFSIDEGEFIGLLGPNGAGKTTMLKILSGILHPTSGEVSVNGFIPWERKNEFKKNFSLVSGQKNQLWWDLPANESLYLTKCIFEIDDETYYKRLDELTELLDVKKLLDIQVRRLSLGERMKLELIAALLHNPKVVFLDEPTIGLDMISQKKIRAFLKEYNNNQKTTIILTSHNLSDIEELCNRAIVINDGSVVFDGALNDISNTVNHVKRIKLNFSETVEQEIISKYGIIKKYSEIEALIEVDKANINEICIQLLKDLPILDFAISDVPIEESVAILYSRKEINNGNN